MNSPLLSQKIASFESSLHTNFKVESTRLLFKNTVVAEHVSQMAILKCLTFDKWNIYYNGEYICKITKNDYLCPSDSTISSLTSIGLERSVAIQAIKLVYSVEVKSSSAIDIYGEESYFKTSKIIFSPESFKISNINFFARYYHKYAVIINEMVGKVKVYTSKNETLNNALTRVASPLILSEITTETTDNGLLLSMPNIYLSGNEQETISICLSRENLLGGKKKTNNFYFDKISSGKLVPTVLRYVEDMVEIVFDEISASQSTLINAKGAEEINLDVEETTIAKNIKAKGLDIESERVSRMGRIMTRQREKTEADIYEENTVDQIRRAKSQMR